jgi:malonyl-CoA decarboxylase
MAEGGRGLGASMTGLWRRLVRGREEAQAPLPRVEAVPARSWRRVEDLLTAAAGEYDGEARARERMGHLLAFYLAAGDDDRRAFLGRLEADYGPVEVDVRRAIEAYMTAAGSAERARAEGRLSASLESPRLRILRQFNLLPHGVHALVDLRADLLRLGVDACPGLDQDLLRLFVNWFDAGFLELQRVGWESPASLLEKLIRYEAVHEIKSWSDLRNRLDSDRRCYAFFHGRMPSEPLIFVEVALVQGMADNVQRLLNPSAPQEDSRRADAAIFYSISNTQEGLRGIGFGNFLIKQVVDDLAAQFPRLSIFSTLSPIPGFRRWLDRLTREQLDAFLPDDEREPLNALVEGGDWRVKLANGWMQDAAVQAHLKPALLRLCAVYLHAEKRDGKPVDPVARFHLGNGARIERLNWLGDTSPKGMTESAGLMVNYQYRLEDIEENHEAFASGGPIAASSSVRKLASGSPAVKTRG